MTEAGARDAVNGAALVVAGIYFYRKLIEPAVDGGGVSASATPRRRQPDSVAAAGGQLLGFGPLASTERFIVGFGFAFLTLSLLEAASPSLAGHFALLIALGAILGNGVAVTEDLKGQLSETKKKVPDSVNPFSSTGFAEPTVRVAAWSAATPIAPPASAPMAKPRRRKNSTLRREPTIV